MGLFKNDRRTLEEALESLRSELGTQSSFGGDVENHAGIAGRVKQVEAAAEQLQRKGRGAEAASAIDSVYEASFPIAVLGGAPDVVAELERLEQLEAEGEVELPPIKGSGTAAQAEEARREEISKLSAKRKEAKAFWKRVLDDVGERVGRPRSA